VLFSISEIRSDALILTPDAIDVVPLPDATPAAVRQHADGFLAAVDEQTLGERAEPRRMAGKLAWLWDAVTGPVLDRLGLLKTPAPGQQWPRLWWCPTGPLSFLPLHASGRGDAAVINRVISSYTDRPRPAAPPAGGTATRRTLVRSLWQCHTPRAHRICPVPPKRPKSCAPGCTTAPC
jgi:hypothetical protein